MESWRKTWRVGVAPGISTLGLVALRKALVNDDSRLLQGATCSPPPLESVRDWPVEAACAISYCGWAEIEARLNGEPESVRPADAVEIALSQNKVAWVSPEDYVVLAKYAWWSQEHHGRCYAHRTEYIGGEGYKQVNIPMHRQIMAAPEGMTVDHVDRNGLNNHRSNLRLLTDADNKRNCRRLGKSVFRGVYPSATAGKWCARYSDKNKTVYLGTFENEQAAALGYNKAVQERFGDKAVLNRFATVAESNEQFARACFDCDQRMGEPAACRFFLCFFDDTPRNEMRAALLPEVDRELNRRMMADTEDTVAATA